MNIIIVIVCFLAVATEYISCAYDIQKRKHYWLQTEVVSWAIQKDHLDLPLVTQAYLADKLPGALGQPGTAIILGKSVPDRSHIGVQILAGYASMGRPTYDLAFMARYFYVPGAQQAHKRATDGQPGSASLAVPLIDTTGTWGLDGRPGQTIALLTGPLDNQPGFSGEFTLLTKNLLQGAEVMTMWGPKKKCYNYLMGLRWVQFREFLTFGVQSNSVINAGVSGLFDAKDTCNITNNFFGLEVGGHINYCLHDLFTLEAIMKIGVGPTLSDTAISGTSQTRGGNLFFLTNTTGAAQLNTGIFAQKANSGCHKARNIAALIEAQLNVYYTFWYFCDAIIGYNFLWLSAVNRAGKALDPRVNTTRMGLAQLSRETVGIGTGPISFGQPAAAPCAAGADWPRFNACAKSLWAQGLVFGLQVRY